MRKIILKNVMNFWKNEFVFSKEENIFQIEYFLTNFLNLFMIVKWRNFFPQKSFSKQISSPNSISGLVFFKEY